MAENQYKFLDTSTDEKINKLKGKPLDSTLSNSLQNNSNSKETNHISDLSKNLNDDLTESDPQETTNFFTKFYCFCSGMISLSILFATLSSNDLFLEQYPDYKYSFWSVFQGHLAIPFSFIIVQFFSNHINANWRFIIPAILSS